MKKVLIAFDVDGTLLNNAQPMGGLKNPVANEAMRTLLVILAGMKNTRIMVWSGGGELYARQIAREIGVAKYVDAYGDKQVISCAAAHCPEPDPEHWHFGTELRPDICIDDVQSFSLGTFNLICREK